MRRSEVAFHYAEIKSNGLTYRLLLSNLTDMMPGHPPSDVMAYFGMGTGEITGARIKELPKVKVIEPDMDIVSSVLYWRNKPGYIGFIDAQPQFKPVILLEDKNGKPLADLPNLNWDTYTQLGNSEDAKTTLHTLSRVHCAYRTLRMQDERLKEFINYVKLTERRPW